MMEMYNGTMASIDEGEIVKSKRARDPRQPRHPRHRLQVRRRRSRSTSSRTCPTSRRATRSRSSSSTSRTRKARSSSRRRRPTSCACGRRSASPRDRPAGRGHARSRRSRAAWSSTCMGVDAFLPGSQIALRRVPNIDELLGQKYEFKIIKLNKRRRNIVVSRRVILEDERAGKREKLMKELAKDQVRKGVVKNITDFGAFIDLGGVDGLLHITDMSWGRVAHPSEMVADRRGARGQGPRHRLGARAHLARPQAAPGLPVEGRRREVPGRHARRRARSSRSPTTAPSSSWSRASRAWSTSPR